VVADRWAYGYLVKPAKLGVSLGKPACRAIVRLMPQPDAVIALIADPSVIHGRKRELSVDEAAQEVEAWATLPIPQLIRVDTERPVSQVVDQILGALDR
ncbi:MAG: hypothetical protein WAL25_06095, partial [Acidimicrobiia bacterium]